jgi:hypothetical protein
MRFCQCGAGYDDGQRRVLRRCRGRPALDAHPQHVRRERRRQSAPAIFAVDFKWRGPEPRSVADRDGTYRIDHRERGDLDAVFGFRRSGAEAALEVGRQRAEARTRAAECESLGCRGGRGEAEIAVRGEAAPLLVAAVQEIETDRAGLIGMMAPRESRGPFFREPCPHAAAASSPNAEPPASNRVDHINGIGEAGASDPRPRVLAATAHNHRRRHAIDHHRG